MVHPRGDRPSFGDRNGHPVVTVRRSVIAMRPPRGDRPSFGDRNQPLVTVRRSATAMVTPVVTALRSTAVRSTPW
jgi:hypothetical protein